MSDAEGSSFAAAFCAASMMLLPCSMAASSALMDFGRPTNSGITICGNTTTSRNGNSGSWVCSVEIVVVMASLIDKRVNDVGANGQNTSPDSNKNQPEKQKKPPAKLSSKWL